MPSMVFKTQPQAGNELTNNQGPNSVWGDRCPRPWKGVLSIRGIFATLIVIEKQTN